MSCSNSLATGTVVTVFTALLWNVEGARMASCMADWMVAAKIPRDYAVSYSRSLAKIRASMASLEHANAHFMMWFGISNPKHQSRILQCAKRPRCAAPCRNKGKCLSDGTRYTCRCPAGFVGRHCEKDLCNPNPCRNSGSCRRHSKTGYHCKCLRGYRGRTCSQMINKCKPNPCKNYVRCKPLVNDFKCVCLSAYHGKTCDQRWISRRGYKSFRNDTKAELKYLERVLLSLQRSVNKALKLRDRLTKLTKRGWRRYSGTGCVYKEFFAKKTFFQSRRTCQSAFRGGDLVSITSAGEWSFVKSHFLRGGAAWLGATDRQREGSWRWIDGRAMAYSAWAGGEPNNHKGREDCLSAHGGGWNDVPCSSTMWTNALVCEVCQ